MRPQTLELTFDEDTHTYYYRGEIFPSVTQVIEPLHDYQGVPPEVMERAQLFGQAAHDTIEFFCHDELDEECLDPHLAGILAAFRAFLRDRHLSHRDFVSERPLASPSLRYAGRPDLVLDGRGIIDIKTRPYLRSPDPVQLIGYRGLYLENGGGRGEYQLEILYLKEDGSYIVYNAARAQAWGMFRMLLDYRRMGERMALAEELIAAWRKS